MPANSTIDGGTWGRLGLLSVLWGGSFFFNGVAVRDLPPLTIVFVRVALAAVLLWPVLEFAGLKLPSSIAGWWPFIGMGLLNNVIPMSLIVTGQTEIAAGMASVLNATTPIFSVLVLAASGDERLTMPRIAGVICGFAGVVVLRGAMFAAPGETVGMTLCVVAALSYGLAGLWGRRKLAGVPPLVAAAGQLTASGVMMAVLAAAVEHPWQLPVPGIATWLSLLGLASLSTAFAYILFFQILARSGATNVMLVTLLVPITAILLGYLVLGERLGAREVLGALMIASALLIMDGRILRMVRRERPTTTP
ncbi:DMT family transporter [Bradyrhizobium prioriisuperbiae]|uniref:DMT family transporter n=1 Tax=Bradyrhizobium prioriisuperbiae TaxID=2854389 RepID=UPI0028EE6AE0|nr:DMT family transporter [Bradyrhizobium prioritasuperba]